jgi:glucose/mannose-6-phosphate isomerase
MVNEMVEDIIQLATVLDKQGMIGFTRSFVEDIRKGQEATRSELLPWLTQISHRWDGIIFLGMGGSGAGGDYISILADKEGTMPVRVSKGYDLPNWWNNNWLVVATSYSGNTEETISATEQALKENGTIIVISSGGILAGMCELSQTMHLISCPSGQPPRTAFGHLFSRQLALLVELEILPNLLDENALMRLSSACEENDILLNPEGDVASLALNLTNSPIAILGPSELAPSITRFKNQLNENSSRFARIDILPEMNHNEVVAWGGVGEDQDPDAKNQALLMISWDGMHPRVKQRMDWFVANCPTENAWKVHGEGASLCEVLMHQCIMMDWLSIALALLHGKDPASIDTIISLKNHLEQISQ